MSTRSIEERIVAYLQLEFGEEDSEDDAIQPSDLKYLGEAEADGIATHYWSFPCAQPCWATVQFVGKQRVIGLTTGLPSALRTP